jgi:bifunctional isochorismate lyase/aryl carrier protein
MQKYFLASFSANAAPLTDLVTNIRALRHWADAESIPVIYTAQPPKQDPADRMLLTDFWGPGLHAENQAAIVDELAPIEADTVLTKWRYSAFQRTGLLELLRERGRSQIIVTGVYARIGCQVTACDAFMYDIQPFVPADAVADFSRIQHVQALTWIAGRCGTVTATRRLLDKTP